MQASDEAGRAAVTDSRGGHILNNLISDTYSLTPTKDNWTFTPPTRTVSVPPDATGQDFTLHQPPVSTTITLSGTVSLPTTLAYNNTQGLTVTLCFPAAVITPPTTFVLTPTLAQDGAGLAFVGQGFELQAYQNGAPQPDFAFRQPVSVTLHYSERDLQWVSDEEQLTLRWWDGRAWQDAAQTCDPPSSYSRDTTKHMLSVSICHLSRFALFGPTQQIYLPLVLRKR